MAAKTFARRADWDRGLEKVFREAGLTDLANERAAMAAANEKLTGAASCRRCGRRVTDPVSIDLGYGPECRGRR